MQEPVLQRFIKTGEARFRQQNAVRRLGLGGIGGRPPFHVEIIGEAVGPLQLASGLPIEVGRSIDELDASDIVIVPSVMLKAHDWRAGRHPRLVGWIERMHQGGAIFCSACSGILLLAETGLFDGKDATVHFGYAGAFTSAFPSVAVHPEYSLATPRLPVRVST